MFRKLVTILVTCLLLSGIQADEEYASEKTLPTVSERVDSIVILHIDDYAYDKVVFIRDNQIMATRLLLQDMQFTTSGEDFILFWQDYSICWRQVSAKEFATVTMPFDPFLDDRAGPWWAMNRNMRDLKQPD